MSALQISNKMFDFGDEKAVVRLGAFSVKGGRSHVLHP